MSLRPSPGETTPENLRADGTGHIPDDEAKSGGNVLERIARKAADPDRDQSPEFLGVNMGAAGRVINRMLFGPPPEVEALRRPTPRGPPVTNATIIQTAANLFDQRAQLLLGDLRGHAYDIALTTALEFAFRDIQPQLARLSSAEVDRLAQLIIQRSLANRRFRDNTPQGRALALYAVRMQVERARLRTGATPPPPPPPPARDPSPAPAVASAPAAAPPTAAVIARPDFIATELAAITALAPPANATLEQREAAAIRVQRRVEATTRGIIRDRPDLADRWIRSLRALRATASFLPVSYNDGWAVAVRDGRAVGTTNTKVSVAPAVGGVRYRTGLRAMNDTNQRLGPTAVDLEYGFAPTSRFVDAGEYAANLVQQHRWTTNAQWPAGRSPWDLAAVTQYFQGLLNANMPMSQVYARWQLYLQTFYQHGESLSIQGGLQVLQMTSSSNARFENDVQGLVNDMLAARTGERLVDCEFFSALTIHVFKNLRDARGQRRFDTRWVSMDVHTTAMVVERGSGPRTWAYVNNDLVLAQGTTASPETVEAAIVDRIARVTRWGKPSVFGIADTYDGAQRLQATNLVGPRVNAYYFDGRGNLSRVSPTDLRAYWIFAMTRPERLTEHAEHASFISSWNDLRNTVPR